MSSVLPSVPVVHGLGAAVARDGYVLVSGESMREALADHGLLSDWPAFADSWEDLAVDAYMADHGRYRRRRHAVYTASAGGAVQRAEHQPHYQSRTYNNLNGGIERWFEPITAEVGDGPSMRAILACCHDVFGHLAPHVREWHVEAHQFRIEAQSGVSGQPTPEGVHRDGVDYVLVLMIRRTNIASGTTTVYAPDRTALGSFTLADPFDATLLDDHRVYHGVTPVQSLDPAMPAHRDVLVVTFRDAQHARPVPQGD
ncbi:MAG TPA: 2OG-Fe dioxygenase family protein [Oleiagrimonas sp.]|nr:2OG-Fe dioxygenase family protein [Oleiagrimonas sp.]